MSTTTPVPSTVRRTPTSAELNPGKQDMGPALHVCDRDDILRGQVYGTPVTALCDWRFIPTSGDAHGAAGDGLEVCPVCSALWHNGVRPRR